MLYKTIMNSNKLNNTVAGNKVQIRPTTYLIPLKKYLILWLKTIENVTSLCCQPISNAPQCSDMNSKILPKIFSARAVTRCHSL
jgi:hypothetical protein